MWGQSTLESLAIIMLGVLGIWVAAGKHIINAATYVSGTAQQGVGFFLSLRDQQAANAQLIKDLQLENIRLAHELQVEAASLQGLLKGHDLRMSEFEVRLRVTENQNQNIMSELVQLRKETERGLMNDGMHSEKLSETNSLMAGMKAQQAAIADYIEMLNGNISDLGDRLDHAATRHDQLVNLLIQGRQ